MKYKKTIFLILLLILFIPLKILAYNCVLIYGTNNGCTLISEGDTQVFSCGNNGAISCSRTGSSYPITTYKPGTGCKNVCSGPNGTACHLECDEGSTITTTKYNNVFHISLTRDNACGEINIHTFSVKYYKSWQSLGEIRTPSDYPHKEMAGTSCYAYTGGKHKEGNDWVYEQLWNRCCGGGGGSITPPTTPPSCWRKEDTTKTTPVYVYKWSVDSPGTGYKKVNLDEKTCKISGETETCSAKIVEPSRDVSASSCNSNTTVKLNDEVTCGSFYEIKCSPVNITLGFDKNSTGFLDNTKIKAGLGFNYSIPITLNKTCTGKFYSVKWQESYKNASEYLRRAKLVNNSKEISYYQNIQNQILDIAKNYNTMVSKYLGNDNLSNDSFTGNMKIYYTLDGKAKTKDYSMISSSIDFNKKEDSKSSIVSKLTDNLSVKDFKVSISESLSLSPITAYINKSDGTITYDKPINLNDYIISTNKVYTDFNWDDGISKIETTIYYNNNGKQISKIVNDKCKLNVYSDKFNYRIIDVSNPFVNNTREISKNWLNNLYNYTGVINKNTWSNNSLYTFNLSKSSIRDIQESNYEINDKNYIKNTNAYLGTCDNSSKNVNGTIKNICDIINSK